MAGFPIHAAASYIPRLLEQGFKVVVCDQTEDPAQAKGLVRREVTRILTRGTVVDPAALDARTDNYLAAVTFKGRQVGPGFSGVVHRGIPPHRRRGALIPWPMNCGG